MFTSGSTGEPKGVPITYGCLQSFLRWILAEHAFEEGREVFLNVVPYSFDVSLMDTYPALVTGGTVTSVTKAEIANPRQLYQLLAASALTAWVSTPSFAQMCLVEPTFNQGMLPRLRRFLFCGETLAPEVASQLLDRFPAAEVWNTYGPTEATVATTSIRITREILDRYSPLPIGYPMPGSRVLVMDEERRELPAGERGEIIISGPNVSPGYLNRPELNETAFFHLNGQRAYRTGDWGRYRDDMLFFEGRIDNQIKLHGHRIEPADVEANLRALAGVRDAVVLPVLRQGAVDSLAAFVILNERPPRSDFQLACELKVQLTEHLPAYMIPRRFSFLESLSDEHQRQGGPAEAGRGPGMIPYADFLYFGILLYIALPTLADPAVARLLARVGLARHRGDADRPVRDHRPPPAGHRCRGRWGHRRLLGLGRARRGPGSLGGDGLRRLPLDRGPGFPLDEDAHLVVLALPRGAAVDPAPRWSGPDSCRWPSQAPSSGSWGSRT